MYFPFILVLFLQKKANELTVWMEENKNWDKPQFSMNKKKFISSRRKENQCGKDAKYRDGIHLFSLNGWFHSWNINVLFSSSIYRLLSFFIPPPSTWKNTYFYLYWYFSIIIVDRQHQMAWLSITYFLLPSLVRMLFHLSLILLFYCKGWHKYLQAVMLCLNNESYWIYRMQSWHVELLRCKSVFA